MISLYIDPGTGSMLFTVFIGVLSAVIYGVRILIIKIKSGVGAAGTGAKDGDTLPIVVFSDSKRYWTTFAPVLDELEKREQNAVYYTMSPDDPALTKEYKFINCEFIGDGNNAFARMNFLKADVVLATTPNLDVFQWKRSPTVKYYVHVPHAAGDLSLYRTFALDYYDSVLIGGKFQEYQVRSLEKLRHLPAKEIVYTGIPYLDELYKRAGNIKKDPDHETTVLLAPTWERNGLLSLYGEELIKSLTDTGYKLIIRPHPQSFTAEKEMIESLMAKFPDGDRLSWNRDNDNFNVLSEADIMISDYSGVLFDFALVFGKPVIYSCKDFKTDPYDAWFLDEVPWNIRSLPRLGTEFDKEHISDMKKIIDDTLSGNASSNSQERLKVRDETWCNIGHSATLIADYLISKLDKESDSE